MVDWHRGAKALPAKVQVVHRYLHEALQGGRGRRQKTSGEAFLQTRVHRGSQGAVVEGLFAAQWR